MRFATCAPGTELRQRGAGAAPPAAPPASPGGTFEAPAGLARRRPGCGLAGRAPPVRPLGGRHRGGSGSLGSVSLLRIRRDQGRRDPGLGGCFYANRRRAGRRGSTARFLRSISGRRRGTGAWEEKRLLANSLVRHQHRARAEGSPDDHRRWGFGGAAPLRPGALSWSNGGVPRAQPGPSTSCQYASCGHATTSPWASGSVVRGSLQGATGHRVTTSR